MNNNISQQNSQHPPLTPERAKAALGNATLLQSFLLPSHTAESKQAHMVKTGQAQPSETPKEKPKEDMAAKIELVMTQKMDEMRKELKDDQQRELDGIKGLIQTALNEPEETTKPS